MNIDRVFLIVLDSLGIGELPDADEYGDKGSNTLKAISKDKNFDIPNLISLGLGNVDGIDYIPKDMHHNAIVGRFKEQSKGKDTTIGHFEIAGMISEKPFPTYPNGFPDDVIEEFEARAGVKTICNKPYSGTEVIKDYGQQSIDEGSVIVYTSADSVFQIAAHEEHFGLSRLYEICLIAREMLTGQHNVGRVIARPFVGENGNFQRTANRHDYAVSPAKKTMIDYLKLNNFSTISIGKIFDIFAGRGFSESNPTKSNEDGMQKTMDKLHTDFKGLCFTNLVDFDMLYGHRNDISGYAKALTVFDKWLGEFLKEMKSTDCLMITADHGCDPSTPSTDHSREYVSGIFYSPQFVGYNLGTRNSFADMGKTILSIFNVENDIDGEAFKL